MFYEYLRTFYGVLVGIMTADLLTYIAAGVIVLYLAWEIISLLTCFQRKFYKKLKVLKEKIEMGEQNLSVVQDDLEKVSLGFYNGFKRFQKKGGLPSDHITRSEALDVSVSGGVLNQSKSFMKAYIRLSTFVLLLFSISFVGGKEVLTAWTLTQSFVLPLVTLIILRLLYFLYTYLKQQMYKTDVESFYDIIEVMDDRLADVNNPIRQEQIFNRDSGSKYIRAARENSMGQTEDSEKNENESSEESDEPIDLDNFDVDGKNSTEQKDNKKKSKQGAGVEHFLNNDVDRGWNDFETNDDMTNIKVQEEKEEVEEQPAEKQEGESEEDFARRKLNSLDVFKKKNIDVDKMAEEIPQTNASSMPFINVDSEYVIKDDEPVSNYKAGANNGAEVLGMIDTQKANKETNVVQGGEDSNPQLGSSIEPDEQNVQVESDEPELNEANLDSTSEQSFVDVENQYAESDVIENNVQDNEPDFSQFEQNEIIPENEMAVEKTSRVDIQFNNESSRNKNSIGFAQKNDKPKVEINFHNSSRPSNRIMKNQSLDQSSYYGDISYQNNVVENDDIGQVNDINSEEMTSVVGRLKANRNKLLSGKAEIQLNDGMSVDQKPLQEDDSSVEVLSPDQDSFAVLNTVKKSTNVDFYNSNDYYGQENYNNQMTNNFDATNIQQNFDNQSFVEDIAQDSSYESSFEAPNEINTVDVNFNKPVNDSFDVNDEIGEEKHIPKKTLYSERYEGQDESDVGVSSADLFDELNEVASFDVGEEQSEVQPSEKVDAREDSNKTKKVEKTVTKKQEKTTKSTSVKNTSTKKVEKKVEKETEEMADGKPGRPKKPVFDDVIQIADDNEFSKVLARAEKLMRKSEEGLSPSQAKRVEKELKMLMDAMKKYKENNNA